MAAYGSAAGRRDDGAVRELIEPLNDPASRVATTAERSFLAAIEGGCQIPAGAYAVVSDQGRTLTITAMVADLDGAQLIRRSASAALADPEAPVELGRRIAEDVLAAGGREILQRLRPSRQDEPETQP